MSSPWRAVTRAKNPSIFATSSWYRDIGSQSYSGHGPQRHRRLYEGRRDQELHRRGGCTRLAEIDGQPQARAARGAPRRSARAAHDAQARAHRHRRGVLRALRADRRRRRSRPSSSSPTCRRRRAAGCGSRATVDFSTRWLGDIVASFLALHPEINIELEATDQRRRSDRGRLRRRGPVRPDAGVDADRAPAVHAAARAGGVAGVPREDSRSSRSTSSTSHEHVLFTPTLARPGVDAAQRRADPRVRPPGAVREQQLRCGARCRARRRRHRAARRSS